MTGPNENAPGLQPGAFDCSTSRKDEPVNANLRSAFPATPPEAPPSLALALAHPNPIVAVSLPSGAIVRFRHAVAKLFIALVAAGDRGIRQCDCAPWTNQVGAQICDIRELLGGTDVIETARGNVRLGTSTTYRLAGAYPFTLEGIE